MDSFNFTNLQAEKANVMLKHRKLRKIASLLRVVEVCFVLVLISRLPLHLPVAAVKNSSEYFKDLSVFVNSPRFVFLIGNAIIITLVAQSGQFSTQGSRKNNPEPDLYHEFILNTPKNQRIQEKQNRATEDSTGSEKQSMRTEDSSIKNKRIGGDMEKYSENHRIYPTTVEDYSMKKHRIDAGNNNKLAEKQRMKTGEVKKGYRRCETEILSRVQSEKEKPLRVRLHRCETENGRKSIQPAPHEEVAGISYPEDHMSNEEFRLTVEAFIARQQRLRREEDYSIV